MTDTITTPNNTQSAPLAPVKPSLSDSEIQLLSQNLHLLPKDDQAEILEALEVLNKRKLVEQRKTSLLAFIKHIDPEYKIGAHHKRLALILEDMAFGRKNRAIVNIAPRFGKSQLTSIYFPAWFIGNFPHKNIMMVSHTSDLAVDFGRKVRNLVDSDAYRDVFPDVGLAADSKSAGRWSTNKGGSYFAVGIGGAIAGRGSDLLCVDGSSIVLSKERGKVSADSVVVGEHILGFGGFNKVEKVFESESTEWVNINGTRLTPNHPIWTFNRGWVKALQLTTHDILDTISLWSYVRSYGEIWYGKFRRKAIQTWRKLLKGLQYLGADAPEMHKSKSSKLSFVWRARRNLLRRVEKVCEVLGGYGASARGAIHAGSDRLGWELYQGELSLGGPRNTSLQSSELCENNGFWEDTDYIPMGAGDWENQRRDTASCIRDENGSRGSLAFREDELGAAPRSASEFGWLRTIGVRLVGGRRETDWGKTGIVMGCIEAASRSKICGLLLGVRRLTTVEKCSGSSARFKNFQVSNSNTFFIDSWMSHNCIDDPHNEQEVLSGNYEVFERTYEWYAYGARTRLSPTGVVALVMTRWAEQDLTGKLIQDMVKNPESDQWEVVEFPAILDTENGQRSLWPEQWSLESLLRTKASMPNFQWSAQYMQQPTSREAAIIKREWWQGWLEDEPPECEYIIMALDAAAEKNTRSDYTSLSTWGVFYRDTEKGEPQANIILLDAIKERWEFPELKRRAYEEYLKRRPDWFLVEKKSAGVQLYQEMRAAGIPVQEVTPNRYTGDKVVRLNSVSDIFSSGLVWYPVGRRWAESMVDEVCGFPAAPNDDQVDTCIYALMRFRSGGFITLPTDREFEDEAFVPRRAAYY